MDDKADNGHFVVGSNDLMETYIVRGDLAKYGLQVVQFPNCSWDARFQLAKDLMQHTVLLSKEDGEDSTGRARRRALSPEEAVDHAIVMAERLFEVGAERGWLYQHDKEVSAQAWRAAEVSGFSGLAPGRN